MWGIILPYVANTSGWLLTETGRQPWVVHGLLRTEDAGSPTLTGAMVLFTLIGFALIYGLLMFADVYLLVKFAAAGPETTRIESAEVAPPSVGLPGP
jgi:cytochrome d ubiquinol oxidase subunit I